MVGNELVRALLGPRLIHSVPLEKADHSGALTSRISPLSALGTAEGGASVSASVPRAESSTLRWTPAHWGCEAQQWVVWHSAPCMYIPSALLLFLLALCSAMVLLRILDFPGVMLAPFPWTHGLFDLRTLPQNMNLRVE